MIFHVAGAFGLVRRRRTTLEFVKQRAVRLAHHLREHVEAAAMRHADAYFAHAEIAATLDDLLERWDQRFAAVEAETLGAGIFDVDEFLEAFGFHQLVENGALALNGEADFLVAAFDALLDPAFLRGIGDVHELHAQRLAIGAAQDGDDLAHGRKFEPEHLVEENPAVEIGFGETVGARIELFFVLFRLEPERIELGVKMAAHAVGADQHQRVDRCTSVEEISTPLPCVKLPSLPDIFSARRFSVSAHCPSSAATRSPSGRSGQFGFFQEAPRALLTTSAPASFRLLKNSRHSASTAAGSLSYLA